MKRSFTLFAVSFIILSSRGQTAIDWTKADCPGNNHTLYNYLNNEEVVIMEFAMGCSSCTDASTYLLSTKDKYAVSNPGKVKVFYMDYWAGNDCSPSVIATTAPYTFDAVFDHCVYEKNDYFSTASPMPGIVIAAGSFHQVIYQKNSFALADTLLIEQAITDFFATAGINENSTGNSFSVFPNPSGIYKTIINYTLTESSGVTIEVYNTSGEKIRNLNLGKQAAGKYETVLNFEAVPNGIYFIKLNVEGSSQLLKLTIAH